MLVWLILVGLSALVGVIAAVFVRRSLVPYVAGAVPWFGLLAALLYSEYFLPYEGGGASMWPIAQLFGGTVAAAVGILSAIVTNRFTVRRAESR